MNQVKSQKSKVKNCISKTQSTTYEVQRTGNKEQTANSFLLVLLIFVLFQITACAQPKQLTILHTNDIHTNFLPHEAAWVRSDPKPWVGGMRELQFAIDSMRGTRSNVLLLDAGDDMTGNPISEIEYKNAYGGGLIEMMNYLGYDVWTPGNHDLDISQENLKNLIAIANHPAVNANVVDGSGKSGFGTPPFLILEKNGIKVGIIGLLTDDLFHVTNTNNLKGLKLLPVNEVTQKIIDSIDSQTDIIIALTHKGVDEDSLLAIGTKGLDIIVGGHSHTRLRAPKNINGVIIVQAGSNCENLGVLDIEVENDKVTSFKGELVQLWAHQNLPATELSTKMDEFKATIDKEYGEVLATHTEDWKRSSNEETAIGWFVADALRLGGNADVGVTNSSGIRKDLLKGNVTKNDLFEVGPFRNYVCTFPLSGKEVKKLAQAYAEGLEKKNSRLQYAGFECMYHVHDSVVSIQKVLVNGKELDESKTYTIATTDYFLNQAEHYLEFTPPETNCTTVTMFNAMVKKLKTEKELKAPAKQFTKAEE
ncbi:MAG: bifunctional metallophosphatase/5'-nucleotidase [Bacteroidetes bacterium]|nr:MAG: bifunctional metallophosphatase/5'-nucleotidase [Bacteroidota bacterium]